MSLIPNADIKLAQDHLTMLAASGITEEHAAERGYETIIDRDRLANLDGNGHGIAKAGRNTPGLLVPMLRADGSTWGYQYRPDVPRLRDGKPIKYETPWQQRNGLDIPPGVGDKLGDPSVPLWVTEGCKKADSGAIHGLCVVALSGVWNWLHTNSAGGKMALPEWRDCALNGRRVIIAFDGDTARNPAVQKAMRGLAAYLATKGACVEYLWLPDTDSKTGLDDFFAAGNTVEDLYRLVKPFTPPLTKPTDRQDEPPKPEQDGARFFDRDGLKVRDLAEDVMSAVPCGHGSIDERLYTYDSGVWVPNDGRIEAITAQRLGNRYRGAHSRNTLDMIRYSPNITRITCDPVSQYINVRNGMIRWADGALVPHSPDYRCTVQLPIDYHPGAQCPQFEHFLADVLPRDCYEPDGDSPGFIWELIGYTLYSGNPLHIAVLLFGKGRNGKGTLIRILKCLLGSRNCSTVGLHELIENRFRSATLFGKLANLAGDLDSRWLANTATFKAITGGDTVQGEYKYGSVFDFQPWALPFYSANKPFGSADSSEGWVARWVVVPFPTSFIGREDRGLDARLQTNGELQGILRRGIEALPALMARGRLPEPKSVRDAKAAFVAASDAVRSWLDEQCQLDRHAWTPRTRLYQAYRWHTDGDGAKLLSAREFYNRVEQVNAISPTTRNGTRGFAGVRLIGQYGAQPGAKGAEGAGSATPVRPHGGKGSEPAPSAPCADGQADRDPATSAYLNGQCRDCHTRPQSAGRPRCDECQRAYLITVDGYER